MRGDVERFFLPFLVCGNPSKQIRKRIFSQLRKMMLLVFLLFSRQREENFVLSRVQLSSSQPSQHRKTGISQCSKSHSCVLRGRRGRWWCEREENVKMFSKKFILTSSLYWPSARRERERWESESGTVLGSFDTDFSQEETMRWWWKTCETRDEGGWEATVGGWNELRERWE